METKQYTIGIITALAMIIVPAFMINTTLFIRSTTQILGAAILIYTLTILIREAKKI